MATATDTEDNSAKAEVLLLLSELEQLKVFVNSFS